MQVFKPTGSTISTAGTVALPSIPNGGCLRIHSFDAFATAVAFKNSGGTTILSMAMKGAGGGPLLEYIIPPDGAAEISGSSDVTITPGYLL